MEDLLCQYIVYFPCIHSVTLDNCSKFHGTNKQSSCCLGRSHGQNFDDDDDGYEPLSTKFSRFGGQRSFTWSFNSDEKLHFDNFCGGFEWRECSQKAKSRTRIWNESDLEEEEEESIDVSLQSHRRVLGLPLAGPLTLDAIKSA